MRKINCSAIRNKMINEAKNDISLIKEKLKLVVVQVQGDDASDVYIRNKKKACDECGIDIEHILLPKEVTFEDVSKVLTKANNDISVTGIMLQLPLPASLKEKQEELLNLIDWKKDVDGLTRESVGRLWNGEECLVPCTAGGIMRLLEDDLRGISFLVINRSPLIGKPLVALLQKRNATVTLAHSKTDATFLKNCLTSYNAIITATGQPKWLKEKDVTIDKNYFMSTWNTDLIIDAGISRDENGKICGDVDLESFEYVDIPITPTPKGTGLLTVAQLMLNVVQAYKLQRKEDNNNEKL